MPKSQHHQKLLIRRPPSGKRTSRRSEQDAKVHDEIKTRIGQGSLARGVAQGIVELQNHCQDYHGTLTFLDGLRFRSHDTGRSDRTNSSKRHLRPDDKPHTAARVARPRRRAPRGQPTPSCSVSVESSKILQCKSKRQKVRCRRPGLTKSILSHARPWSRCPRTQLGRSIPS